jgi:hypothetical protein
MNMRGLSDEESALHVQIQTFLDELWKNNQQHSNVIIESAMKFVFGRRAQEGGFEFAVESVSHSVNTYSMDLKRFLESKKQGRS